jgi:molybdopterin molybdotransferase
VTACGGEPVVLGIAQDDRDSLMMLATGARGTDMLVTTGGVSVGEHDLVRSVLGERGLEVAFWRIAMRPGKPLLFGRIDGTPMLGLPGNPVSSMVCALIFLRPAIERMLGAERAPTASLAAVVTCDLQANDRRQDYLRATLSRDADATPRVTPYTRQDSSMLSHLAHADCLIVRPPLAAAAPAGTVVEVLPLNGGVVSV